MNRYVTDTMALIKALNGQKVINDKIHKIFMNAEEGKNLIIIPAGVMFEIGYLYEKGRITASLDHVRKVLEDSVNYIEEPLRYEIIECSFEIKDIPELHDRLIAGTAKFLNLPLLTNDPVIKKSKFIKTV